MKKYLAAAGIAGTVGLAGLSTAGIVAAQSNGSSTNRMDSLATAIADKFNLNKDEVQKVFDEQHAAMEQQRDTQVKDQIAQLVSDGKLTQDQADKLLAKRAEIQKQREANRDEAKTKTRSEMRGEMSTQMNNLRQWAKDNDIDTQYLRYVVGGPGGPHGGHGPGMDMDADDVSSNEFIVLVITCDITHITSPPNPSKNTRSVPAGVFDYASSRVLAVTLRQAEKLHDSKGEQEIYRNGNDTRVSKYSWP